ncbi:unnamed protein product, partial [Staurois parvus]
MSCQFAPGPVFNSIASNWPSSFSPPTDHTKNQIASHAQNKSA